MLGSILHFDWEEDGLLFSTPLEMTGETLEMTNALGGQMR